MTEIINKSDVPDWRIEKLIEFCLPRKFKPHKIIFKNTVEPYSAQYVFPAYKTPWIVIRIGHYSQYPLNFQLSAAKIKKKGYYGKYYYKDRYEALVFILSHEAMHAHCHQNPKLKHCLYQDLPRAEKIADNFAFKKLNEFRRLKKEGINIFKDEYR